MKAEAKCSGVEQIEVEVTVTMKVAEWEQVLNRASAAEMTYYGPFNDFMFAVRRAIYQIKERAIFNSDDHAEVER